MGTEVVQRWVEIQRQGQCDERIDNEDPNYERMGDNSNTNAEILSQILTSWHRCIVTMQIQVVMPALQPPQR